MNGKRNVGVAVLVCGLAVGLAGAVEQEKGKNLLAATNKVDSWRFEQHEQGKGSMKAEGEAMALTVTEADGTDWHVQAARPNLDLQEGKEYSLSLKAKADAERSIQVNALVDQDDYHAVGLNENVDLTKDWKDYQFTFKAEGVAPMKQNRITLVVGNEKGTVWVKEMVLVEKKGE